MREKLDDVNRSLEESRNSLEKLKRESSTKSEKDRLQIGELQLEVSRLKSQLEEKVEKYEGIKASLVEQLNREKEAKFEMVIISYPQFLTSSLTRQKHVEVLPMSHTIFTLYFI